MLDESLDFDQEKLSDIKKALTSTIDHILKNSKGVIIGLNIHNDGKRIPISKFDRYTENCWQKWVVTG